MLSSGDEQQIRNSEERALNALRDRLRATSLSPTPPRRIILHAEVDDDEDDDEMPPLERISFPPSPASPTIAISSSDKGEEKGDDELLLDGYVDADGNEVPMERRVRRTSMEMVGR